MVKENCTKEKSLIPALRYHVLTPLFDPLLRLTMREQTFRRRLMEQARIGPGHRVLDVGGGTATLAIMLKQACPNAEIRGLDGDEGVLELARRKTANSGVDIPFDHVLSYKLPYPNGVFDRVVSSLVFHHLTREHKIGTLSEIYRVLAPGGELHIADFGEAQNALMRSVFFVAQLFEGFATTTDNVKGLIPVLMEQAGFSQVEETSRMPTLYGTLSFYKGSK